MFLKSCLAVLRKIPLINSIVYFPWHVHKEAIPKFIFLWVFASSPALAAILLSPVPDGSDVLLEKLLYKFTETMSASEQYVYAASFMSPLLYMVYDRYRAMSEAETLNKKFKEIFRSLFDGYGVVSFVAIMVLFVTTLNFSAIKSGMPDYKNTFIYGLTSDAAVWVYLYAVYCWYLSLLDGSLSGGGFLESGRDEENDLSSSFAKRISSRRDG